MVLLYYTQTYFLDAVLETIQSLKKVSELHLLIEIAPESKKSTIIDIPSLSRFATVEHWKSVLDEGMCKRLAPYFEGIASIHFVVHKSAHALSPASLFVCAKLIKFIHRINPQIIHFDTVSVRSIGLLTLASRYKFNITVHDPVSHSGEDSWKTNFVRWLYYNKAKHLFFYSAFAEKQFRKHYAEVKSKSSLLHFQPFSFIRTYQSLVSFRSDYILFFGRMSPYKGIDILLDAIPRVLAEYPSAKFVLAGSAEHLTCNHDTLLKYSGSVSFLPHYFSSSSLADLISHAQFIVCPYRDATQSGVLMTAFALGKTVIATNVGAFPEYIRDKHDGLLIEPDSSQLSQAISKALSGNYYLDLEKNINPLFSSFYDIQNQQTFLSANLQRA
jgi:glycosyltransferase involved in cell wall biosynthesis